MFGAPDIDARAVTGEMRTVAPQWLRGCGLRNLRFTNMSASSATACRFTRTVLTTIIKLSSPGVFAFKAIRRLYSDYPLWRDFAY
jgi:hypothetical protein